MSDGEDALAQGAARFEKIARIVKENQLARTRSRVPAPVTEAFQLSPEEAWSKKYMTRCIGPVCYPPLSGGLPFAMQGPPPAEQPKSQAYAPKAEPALSGGRGPIGAAIGKPGRPRGWLSRLFRGR